MKRWPLFLPLFVFLLLALGLAASLRQKQQDASATPFAQHIGEAAPLMVIDKFDPSKKQGQPYLLNFFASWCLPCHAEHEHLLYLKERGVNVIGIAFRDQPQAVQAFLQKQASPFSLVAHDDNGRGSIEWGLTGVPETFIVDSNGVIRWHRAGPITASVVKEEILPLWQQLL